MGQGPWDCQQAELRSTSLSGMSQSPLDALTAGLPFNLPSSPELAHYPSSRWLSICLCTTALPMPEALVLAEQHFPSLPPCTALGRWQL